MFGKINISLSLRKILGFKLIIKFISALIVFGVPFLVVLRYILNSSANVVFSDDFYYIVNIVKKYYESHLAFTDLWTPYNGARNVIQKLIFLFSAKITDLNVQIVMCLSLFVILGTAILLYKYYTWNVNNKNQYYNLVAFMPVTLLLFSIRQWENFLQASNDAIFIMFFFLVFSIFMMQKSLNSRSTKKGVNLDKYFIFSILTSAITTFTFVQSGILVWIILVTQILLSGLNKQNGLKLFIYSSITIMVLSAYFFNNETTTQFRYFISHLFFAVEFVVVHIGNSIIGEFSNEPNVSLSFAFGVVLLALYVYALFIYIKSNEIDRRAAILYFLLIVFSLAGSIITAYGRINLAFETIGNGLEYAASSRYSSLGIIGVVGVYLFFLYYINKYFITHPKTLTYVPAFGVLIILIFMGYCMSTYQESRMSPYRRIYYENLKNIALRDLDTIRDEDLQIFNNSPQLIRDGLSFLKIEGLNVYDK